MDNLGVGQSVPINALQDFHQVLQRAQGGKAVLASIRAVNDHAPILYTSGAHSIADHVLQKESHHPRDTFSICHYLLVYIAPADDEAWSTPEVAPVPIHPALPQVSQHAGLVDWHVRHVKRCAFLEEVHGLRHVALGLLHKSQQAVLQDLRDRDPPLLAGGVERLDLLLLSLVKWIVEENHPATSGLIFFACWLNKQNLRG
mmetsp:Transcript_64460/g.181368  ORF Transcript_64460/g.181368 Transcript_64460/m.181368 type:complete len:201 (+) Transcript_64460:1133-1735(+)